MPGQSRRLVPAFTIRDFSELRPEFRSCRYCSFMHPPIYFERLQTDELRPLHSRTGRGTVTTKKMFIGLFTATLSSSLFRATPIPSYGHVCEYNPKPVKSTAIVINRANVESTASPPAGGGIESLVPDPSSRCFPEGALRRLSL